MRKESADEVTEAAQRRLQLLGRELALAGLHPGAPPEPVPERVPERAVQQEVEQATDPVGVPRPEPVGEAVAGAVLVPDPGRHARSRADASASPWSAWLHDRLPAPLQGRVSLAPSHVVLVTGLVAVVLAVVAWTTIRSAPQVVPVPVAHTSPGPAASTAALPVTGARPTTAARVVVDVAGKVRRPGVVTLPSGSRVIDAVERAGGARAGVGLSGLNLARVLVDGEQILVGVAPVAGVAAAAAAPSAGAGGALVNLNTATLEQLESLPGVGPVTAQKILDWRTSHGTFSSIDELLEVAGIGEKTLADMSSHLTL